jgi:hypothetical protein
MTALSQPRTWVFPELSSRAQDVLRLTAIGLMVLDHINRVFFFERILVFSVLGRLAFPLFALLLAYNLTARAVPWQRYIAPLLIAGVAAQFPFVVLFQPLLNIMFTLLLGVLVFPIYDLLERAFGKGLGVLAWLLVILPNLFCDYPMFGAYLVPFGCILVQRKAPMYWLPFLFFALFSNQLSVNAFVILLLPVLVFGSSLIQGKRFDVPRFVWWAVYPAHLFVLMVLERL